MNARKRAIDSFPTPLGHAATTDETKACFFHTTWQ